MGGNAFTEAVQRELGLPYELAEQLKKGQDVEGATYDDARPVLKAMTDNILLEVEKTFDFFKATASNDRIDRIVLSGGASRVDGFAEALASRFDTEVISFDPVPSGVDRRLQAGRALGRATSRRSRRWPLAWRFARWATDDSHQPRRHRAEGQGRLRRASTPAQKMTVIGSLILVLAALGIGWRYWALEQSAANVERQLNEARREEQRLAAILKQVAGVRSPARACCSSAPR